ncbi:pyruvate formate-lyase-activating protein [Clostridium sediminicola]|uniref:pyruvate formate-lyase-activating protein n=1 Tax=Clostridium sediminicola TaxID=3114879 RepID=UPI0031F277DF
MKKGRIHSIESMGLVDGPGIRTVVFFQGCNLRCSYCHNPDTWSTKGGEEITSEELIAKILRFKPYFLKSGGGVTFSGGDPLMQPEFLLECLKLCKKNNIHTTLDTSGFGKGNYKEILKYTDLVLLDVKQYSSEGYKSLTGRDTTDLNIFLNSLKESNVPVWIRHVVVPGLTDSKSEILKIADFVNTNVSNVQKVELLPYHTLGIQKYRKMDIPYRLEGIEPMDKDKNNELQVIIESKIFVNKYNKKVV